MSVGTQLGLADPEQALLAQARALWPTWGEQYRALRVVGDLLDLPGWIASAPRDDADEVLHTLARLASPSGGDDLAATGALAWLLLPGASLVAHRLRSLTGRIDEVVAAQLWLEVREFPWQRRRKVAANVVMNTRRGVLRELGVGAHLREVDPAWSRTVPLDPGADSWRALEARPAVLDPAAGTADAAGATSVAAETELAEVLTWALSHGVVEQDDVDLLLRLAVAADEAGVTRTRCGQGGLCSRKVALTVAGQTGVSSATVRRRASACLQAMATAYTAYTVHGQIPA